MNKRIFFKQKCFTHFKSSATIQNAVSAFSQLFRRNKKLNFFFESGSFVLKSWTGIQNMTRNDIQACIQCFMHCVILQSDEISVQFWLFCPNIYCFSTQIRHFVLYSFLGCWWSVMTGVLRNYSSSSRRTPSISFQTKCIWLTMTGYRRRLQIQHFGSCFRYSILSLFSTLTFAFSGFW